MSSFSGQNWWQSLSNLFGQAGGAPAAPSAPQVPQPFGFSGAPSAMGQAFNPAAQQLKGAQWYRDPWKEQGGLQQQPQMPTYGQVLAGGAIADFARGEQARQQELNAYLGLLGNLATSMQGAGQMVQDARGAADRGWQMAQQQAGRMRGAADQAQQFYNIASNQIGGAVQEADRMREAANRGQEVYATSTRRMNESLSDARRRFDQSIGTAQASKAGFDVGRRDDTAAQVMGIQQQYKNELDSIARRDDLTPEQKNMMTDELKQNMRQQSSAIAAQADAQARQTMLQLDQNISSLQANAAQSLGGMGISASQVLGNLGMQSAEQQFQAAQSAGQIKLSAGQALGSLGLQTAAQRQQAEQDISSFMGNMHQYNTSMLQGAQAAALQYVLNGNQQMAAIINAAPFGPTSIFGTIAHMIQAVDEDRSNRISPQMGQMFGRLA